MSSDSAGALSVSGAVALTTPERAAVLLTVMEDVAGAMGKAQLVCESENRKKNWCDPADSCIVVLN